jgi:hypothetical protein
MLKKSLSVLFFLAGLNASPSSPKVPVPDYITAEQAGPVLQAMSTSLPPSVERTADSWPAWVRKADGEVRARLDRGEEDTLSNLVRFGVTFTKEYRIDDEYFRRFGESSLVNAFADRRVDDLIRALGTQNSNPGLAEMRGFVEQKGYSLKSAPERNRLKRYLLANLQRLHKDFVQSGQQARTNRDQMFQERGISLDSNLWPDYDLHQHMLRMARNGMLKPASVRKVAIAGPGLDFVNKQEGVDYYPPQTIQPFAVVDSLLQLGLASPEVLEIHTLDISSRVNVHIQRARQQAARGEWYTLQLP